VSPWFGRVSVLVLIVLQFVVRVPFAMRAEKAKVAIRRRGGLEIGLMALVTLGYLILPVLATVTPLLAFADYPVHPVQVSAGLLCAIVGLWLCYRSHADLGENWSVTLELKESHHLVTTGVYRRLRHPMYTALFLTAIAQALLLPNWFAGPAYFVAFGLLFALRVGPEEQMMREQFGHAYQDYATRTKRLIPGLF
jgi:protein-S-isoprenylcysteine O-methyltransferase Ste14